MTTQYTTILKLALPVQGELSGTWGDIVNNNITQMVEQAVAGKATVNSWTGNAHTLTTADGTTAESRCAILELTDTGTALSGAGTVTCPTNTKLYIVDNNTAQIITVKTSGGTGVAVPVGKTMLVYCDGTNVVEGVTHANSLSLGTSTSTVNAIATATDLGAGGSSNSNLPTQLAVKTYVDSQVGTVDTLAEILANGNVTGANDIDVENAQKVQFRDSAIYINSSADGQLDLVADTEIQIAATTVDLNGNLDVSGTALVTGVLTTTAATVFNGGFASNADSTLGTDKKVQFRDAAIYINSSADGQLDIVADGEVQIATALVDINGNLDVSGTTNISGSTTFTKNAIASVAISGVARSSNTVTVTTSAVHGLSVNDLVNLNGVTDTSFNGYFTVTAVSSTTVFTFSQTAANASSSGGSTTEIVYNLNASGTALNQMNGPLNITANSPIDGLEITQSGAGNGLHVTGTTDLVGNTTLTGNLDVSGTASATNVSLPDDGVLSLGTSDELTLKHHNSGYSHLINTTGTLYIDSDSVTFRDDDGSPSNMVVSQTGVDVTGTVTTDGLTSAGDVAITGGSSGSTVLTLTTNALADTPLMVFQRTGGAIAGKLAYEDGNTAMAFGTTTAHELKFLTGNTERMQITSAGALQLSDVDSPNDINTAIYSNSDVLEFEAFGTNGAIAFSTGSGVTERMRIASDGSVGIGTSSPSGPLHVQTSHTETDVTAANTNSTVIIGNSAAGNGVYNSIKFSANQQDMYIMSFNNSTQADRRMGFFLGSVAGDAAADERLSILGNGSVGIGVTNPTQPLVIQSNSGAAAIALNGRASDGISTLSLYANDGTTSQGYVQGRSDSLRVWAASGDFLSLGSGGSEAMRIDSSGNVGIGGTPATARLEVTGAFAYASGANSLATTVSKASARIRGSSDASTSLFFGSLTNDAEQYIQSSNGAGDTADDLVLNPFGGKVGIGTSTPATDFVVSNSGAEGIEFYAAGTNLIQSYNRSGAAYVPLAFDASTIKLQPQASGEVVINDSGYDVDFRVESDDNANMLLVDADNNEVIIGKSSGSTSVAGIGATVNSSIGQFVISKTNSGTHNAVRFYHSGANVGNIQYSDSATSYLTSSDRRLKENISNADDAGDLIDAIQVRKFDWIADGEHQRYGMVAQELNTVAPEAVSEGPTEEDMMGVDYSKLVPMLVKEIQSLRARVAQLEA